MKNQVKIFLSLLIVTSLIACEEGSYESYRYELWKKLIANDYQFDFVGTQYDEGTYPEYQEQAFDRDHEGIGGIESVRMRQSY